MAKVIGFGGLFWLCEDTDKTKAWYSVIIGSEPSEYGGFDFLMKDAADHFPTGARTVFSPFAAGSDYFKPSELGYMINLMVDDLDGVLARAKENGIEEIQLRESYDYGDFAWLMDPDGRKVELWQPVQAEKNQG